jgi:hypothetical protein
MAPRMGGRVYDTASIAVTTPLRSSYYSNCIVGIVYIGFCSARIAGRMAWHGMAWHVS